MVLSSRAKYLYGLHGWNDADIEYLEEHADYVEDHDGWALGVATAPDGVVWIYPTAKGNVFTKTLWKRIRDLIELHDNVVIPINENQDKVRRVAKKYNGYLVDNLYLFGDELSGLQFYKGENRWSHSTN